MNYDVVLKNKKGETIDCINNANFGIVPPLVLKLYNDKTNQVIEYKLVSTKIAKLSGDIEQLEYKML